MRAGCTALIAPISRRATCQHRPESKKPVPVTWQLAAAAAGDIGHQEGACAAAAATMHPCSEGIPSRTSVKTVYTAVNMSPGSSGRRRVTSDIRKALRGGSSTCCSCASAAASVSPPFAMSLSNRLTAAQAPHLLSALCTFGVCRQSCSPVMMQRCRGVMLARYYVGQKGAWLFWQPEGSR